MTNAYSFILTFWAVMFWVFRLVVAICESMEIPFVCTTLNLQLEIIIIFVTLPFLLLVIKRNLIATTIYLGIYVVYFGTAIGSMLWGMSGGEELIISNSASFISAIFGVIIPILIFLDVLFNKNKKNYSLDRKTEWYYGNDKFDRQYDERADKNQYKIK